MQDRETFRDSNQCFTLKWQKCAQTLKRRSSPVIRGRSHYDTDINVDTAVVHGEPPRTLRQSSSLAFITAVAAAADIASDADQVDCEITYSLLSGAGDWGFHAAVSQAQQPAATFLIHDWRIKGHPLCCTCRIIRLLAGLDYEVRLPSAKKQSFSPYCYELYTARYAFVTCNNSVLRQCLRTPAKSCMLNVR